MKFELKDVKCPHCGKMLTDLQVMQLIESGFPDTVFAIYYDDVCAERHTLSAARVDAIKLWKRRSTTPNFEGEIPVVWQPGDRCGHIREEDGSWIWYDEFTDTEWYFDPGTGELTRRY